MSKIYFQGTFGAYSHLAALSIDPKAEYCPVKLLMIVLIKHPRYQIAEL